MAISGSGILSLALGDPEGLLALAFFLAGATKFDPREGRRIGFFAKTGVGQWLASAAAAGLLACTVAGVILAHFFLLQEPSRVDFLPLLFLLILMAMTWKRRTLSIAWQRK